MPIIGRDTRKRTAVHLLRRERRNVELRKPSIIIMPINGVESLRARVAALDDPALDNPDFIGTTNADIARFVIVMSGIASKLNRGPVIEVDQLRCITPERADEIAQRCRLLRRLASMVPDVAHGPLRRDAQFWIGAGRSAPLPTSNRALSESYFTQGGLFTSTGVFHTTGMWRAYLDVGDDRGLFSRPFRAWKVRPHPDVRVVEIASAMQWVDFVRQHPLRRGPLLRPNWEDAARAYDAVHVTLQAIVAMQGLSFPIEEGVVEGDFWDVEQTRWLHWCFESIESRPCG